MVVVRAGVCGGCCIVNLPGRPVAVRQNLAVLMPLLGHVASQLTAPQNAATEDKVEDSAGEQTEDVAQSSVAQTEAVDGAHVFPATAWCCKPSQVGRTYPEYNSDDAKTWFMEICDQLIVEVRHRGSGDRQIESGRKKDS